MPSLCLILTVHDNSQTGLLTFLLTSFNIFENGGSIVISVMLCDIGKEQVLKHKRKAVSTISGICDGVASVGSIAGQLLFGLVEGGKGWGAGLAMFAIAACMAPVPAIPYMVYEIRSYLRKKRGLTPSGEPSD